MALVAVTYFPFHAKPMRGNIFPSSFRINSRRVSPRWQTKALAVFVCAMLMDVATPMSQIGRKSERERRGSG